MSHVQVIYETELEYKHGHQCIRFPIQHSHYNGLEERGSERRLLLTEGSFIQGLNVTLDRWSVIHDIARPNNPPLHAIMRATDFEVDRDDRPLRIIGPLDGRSTVCHAYNGLMVWVHLDTFISYATANLRDTNSLALRQFSFGFPQEFRRKWEECIERLGGPAAPARPGPFDPDANLI